MFQFKNMYLNYEEEKRILQLIKQYYKLTEHGKI